MDILKQLLGRLHPLIVHLPIGFILLALLLQVYDRKRKAYQKVIRLIYLWAGYAAVIACVTGYLQYLGEGYSYDSVKWHLWAGIATALGCFLMWARLGGLPHEKVLPTIPVTVFSVFIFALVSFTGHEGGNITHGEDYLVEPLPIAVKRALGYEVFEEQEILLSDASWENAVFYTDVVAPILNNNCVSCHNPKKAKGGLILNTKEGIQKSGEHGPVAVANHPERSDLFERMVLPKQDDRHMPPDGKKQPSKEEIQLVRVWIEKGLSFDMTIGELGLEKSWFISFFPNTVETDYPNKVIAVAPLDSIAKVKQLGLHVEPISKTTNFLKVSALNLPDFDDTYFASLLPVKEQIAVLDLGNTKITDAISKDISTLPNLTILKLDNTQITGAEIAALKSLQHLRSLNVSQTNFKEEYLKKLEHFPQLKTVFLFNPDTDRAGTDRIGEGNITVEYGNYALPTIASDSLVY